ncbi:hypothetical protein AC1031_000951 [Aphanomyces cochlioides]|nr:hypothetical protein AC1031_000951 [Aphanomyces cochlioides]
MEATKVERWHDQRKIVDVEMARRVAAENKAMQRKNLRRVQSKINQRRYRAEQKCMTEHLYKTVMALNTEVARLEGRLESLRLTIPVSLRTFEPETNVAKEYFHVFCNGYRSDETDPVHKHQHDFLTSVMKQDLVFMGRVGIDKLLDQWSLYSKSFQSVEMVCQGVEVVSFSPNVIIHGGTVLRLHMSIATIEMLFPHLRHNERLTTKLVGRELSVVVQHIFEFDRNCKVQRFETHTNLVTALLTLLGPLDTSAALNGIRMSISGEIVASDLD